MLIFSCITIGTVASVNGDVFPLVKELSYKMELFGSATNNVLSKVYFHDSISKPGHVLHGKLKSTHDSLVSQWIRDKSVSLILERGNIGDLELLIKEIEAEVLVLEKQKRRSTILILVLFFVVVLGFLFRRRMFFLKNILGETKTEVDRNKATIQTKSVLNISSETVAVISHLLANFEKEHGFLEANMTLNLLAQKMQTNSTYLSKVVNSSKGVNFSVYLNDLRISYIVKRLEEEPKLRLYTSKALAEEAGYKTRESFTKAFYKQVGVFPTVYLSKFERSKV